MRFRSTLPKETDLQSACRSHRLSPCMEPPFGIEPKSARYQRAALPLCYGGKWRRAWGTIRTPEGAHRLAGEPGILTGCALRIGGRPTCRSPHLAVPSRFERAPGAVPVDLPCWRSVIGIEPSTLRLPGASNAVGEPTPARSVVADSKRVELSTFQPHPLSKRRPEPSGDAVRIWYSGSDSNGHCPTSKDGDSCQLVYRSMMVRAARVERALCQV